MQVAAPHTWHVGIDVAEMIQGWLRSRVILEYPDGLKVKRFGCISLNINDLVANVKVSIYNSQDMSIISNESINYDVIGYPEDLEMFSYGSNLVKFLGSTDDVDMLIVNRPGIIHPRYFGPSSHIGIITNLPTISLYPTNLYSDITISKDDVMTDTITFETSPELYDIAEELSLPIIDRTYGGLSGRIVDDIVVSIGHRMTLEMAVGAITVIRDRIGLEGVM